MSDAVGCAIMLIFGFFLAFIFKGEPDIWDKSMFLINLILDAEIGTRKWQ